MWHQLNKNNMSFSLENRIENIKGNRTQGVYFVSNIYCK